MKFPWSTAAGCVACLALLSRNRYLSSTSTFSLPLSPLSSKHLGLSVHILRICAIHRTLYVVINACVLLPLPLDFRVFIISFSSLSTLSVPNCSYVHTCSSTWSPINGSRQQLRAKRSRAEASRFERFFGGQNSQSVCTENLSIFLRKTEIYPKSAVAI